MIYKEEEIIMNGQYFSICKSNLGKTYSQWMVPCRILDLTPAEYVKLLVETYGAIVEYHPNNNFLSRYWEKQADESRWRLYINKRAREKGFHI